MPFVSAGFIGDLDVGRGTLFFGLKGKLPVLLSSLTALFSVRLILSAGFIPPRIASRSAIVTFLIAIGHLSIGVEVNE